jgi:hypothetical protein
MYDEFAVRPTDRTPTDPPRTTAEVLAYLALPALLVAGTAPAVAAGTLAGLALAAFRRHARRGTRSTDGRADPTLATR